MQDSLLFNIVLLLILTVFIVSVSRRIHVPPLLNYIIVGIIVGPYGFEWIGNEGNISFLAEFGIVFLLFSIGLEFSLSQMVAMRKQVFGLGTAQVFITTLLAYGISELAGLGTTTSIIVASAFALSSTAIVIKQLTEQSEIQSRHGKASVGILIFQDIMAIPLLILIPALGLASGDSLLYDLAFAFLKGAFVVVVMLLVGRYLLRPIFHEVASSKSSELFTLTVLTVVLTAAAFTEGMGISMTLGAFMAGMMLGETEYRHQIESDIKPFQNILLGLFFITVGMMISPIILIEHWLIITLITLTIFTVKGLVIFGIMKYMFHKEEGVALRTALSVSQVGEFGLVLITLALSYSLIPPDIGQLLLTSAVISMMISAFLIKFNGRIAKRVFPETYGKGQVEISHTIEANTQYLKDHVILCGFGRVGQTTAKFLKKSSVPFIALDLDILRVKEAQQAGENVYYGDSSKQSILGATHIDTARILIITFTEYHTTLKILKAAKTLRPDLQILVRTHDDSHVNDILEAGATEVIPDIFESSIMLASHLLLMIGQPPSQVLKQTREVRKNRYRFLDNFYPGETDTSSSEQHQVMGNIIQTIVLEENAYAVGKSLKELPFDDMHITVDAIKRGSVRGDSPDHNTRLKVDDILVVAGLPEDIEKITNYIHLGS